MTHGQGSSRAVMSVFLLRPRVADLVFQLYGRPLHPEFFDILAVRKIQREDYELTVRITRTGHVITWENRDVCLTEVTTAADQLLPERRRLLSYRIRGEHSDSLACAHGISYQMCLQVKRCRRRSFCTFTMKSWPTEASAACSTIFSPITGYP